MALLALVVKGAGEKLIPQEAASGIFGSVSLATWIFLLVPQLILNYKTGSADGISLAFLLVWLLGDITNLWGAIWADLVPTVIALAIYFCFADLVLLSQCFYYNHINARKRQVSTASTSTVSEVEPLLSRRRSSDTIGLPGSHRRRSSARSGTGPTDTLTKILEEEEEGENPWLRNTISIVAVIAVGAAGWAIAWQMGAWVPTPIGGGEDVPSVNKTPVGASILGYISAVCYLGARIPQIIKNYRDKSCEGLALLFFLLSLMGNFTYGAGILCHSLEKEYLITNLPWLIGSLGTMAEDAIIFLQFRIYGTGPSSVAVE